MSAQFELQSGDHVSVACGPVEGGERLIRLDVVDSKGDPARPEFYCDHAAARLTKAEARALAEELLRRAT
jgi:hypothetical protein